MKNYGELEFGEIPEPLKYVRDYKQTTVSNGIKVCTEKRDSGLAGVSVFVKAGSRQENLDTSGSAYLLQRMAMTKDAKHSVENMGA